MALNTTTGGRKRTAGIVSSKRRTKAVVRITNTGVTILTADEINSLDQLRAEQKRITSNKQNSIDFLKSIGVMNDSGKIDDSFCLVA